MVITVNGLELNGEQLYMNTVSLKKQLAESKVSIVVNGEKISCSAKFYDRIDSETEHDTVVKVSAIINGENVIEEKSVNAQDLMCGVYESITKAIPCREVKTIANMIDSAILELIEKSMPDGAIVEGMIYSGISLIKEDGDIIGTCGDVKIEQDNYLKIGDADFIKAHGENLVIQISRNNAIFDIDVEITTLKEQFKIKNISMIKKDNFNCDKFIELKTRDKFEDLNEFMVYRRNLCKKTVSKKIDFLDDLF